MRLTKGRASECLLVRWSLAIAGSLIGLAFAIFYFFLAFGASGAGHGTGIFFSVVCPLGLGLLIFPVLGFLAGDLRPFTSKVIFVGVMVVHYALAINFLRFDWATESEYFEKSWNYSHWSIILPTLSYLCAQVLLWFLFIRSLVVGRRSDIGSTE
jgi:hypothetical protein